MVARRQARVLVRAPASDNQSEGAKQGERREPCNFRVRGGGKRKGGEKEGGEGEGEGGKEVARRQACLRVRAPASDNRRGETGRAQGALQISSEVRSLVERARRGSARARRSPWALSRSMRAQTRPSAPEAMAAWMASDDEQA